MTLFSTFALDVLMYYAIPGFFPAAPVPGTGKSWFVRLYEIMINHYVLSFAMYWMHRACHVVPWLWKYVHSIHHWANHPLSRATYEGATFVPVCVIATVGVVSIGVVMLVLGLVDGSGLA